MTDIQISEITQVNEEVVFAFQRLIPQLSTINAPPTQEDLMGILTAPGTTLLVARHARFGEEIMGSLTLIVYQIPTGRRARIEDVIVDARARGMGIGEALTALAIQRAFAAGAANVELTSNPARLAANRLYQRLGFSLRQTNVYRFLPENKPDENNQAGNGSPPQSHVSEM